VNRWKWNRSWILVWGSLFLVVGSILYIGYRSELAESTQEKAKSIKTVQAASAAVSVNSPDNKSVGKLSQVNIKQGIPEDKKVTPKPSDSAEAESILSISDFPSPVKGKVLRGLGNYYSEAFDDYLFHGGIDYSEPEGTVIRATHGGKVVLAGQDPILGQKVTLDCGGGWLVTYGGLENLSVQIGETLEKMDKIGQVGFSPGAEGSNDQSQLHYEVWHNDQVQSPK
jgi:Membrane-bound metallopeptidase